MVYKTFVFAVICMLSASASFAEIVQRGGEVIPLATGELFIPDDFTLENNRVNLVFHLHLSPAAAHKAFAKSRLNAVQIALHLGSFSSPYRIYFSNPERFDEILDNALDALKMRYHTLGLKWGHVCVTAFSGGYGGAREFMRFPRIYDQIGSLILLDCPHTSYTEDGKVYPPQMAGFVKFAIDAIAGNKTFIMTHSQIVPDGYASTTECADYLIASVSGKRKPWDGVNAVGMEWTSRYDAGQFHIYGYKGKTAPDHMKHLRGMYLYLNQIQMD